MGIKRFIFNRLFNKRQRRIIWQALLYSEYRYERRGNVDAAARVKTVINETIKVAGVKQEKFYESEVAEIVKREVTAVAEDAKKKIENAYNEGKKAGINQAISEMEKKAEQEKQDVGTKIIVGFAKPIEVDLEKCEDCEHKDDCAVKSAMENAGMESESEDETKQSQEREIPVEGDSSDAPDAVGDAPEPDIDEEGDAPDEVKDN